MADFLEGDPRAPAISFSETTKINDGRTIDFSTKTPRLDKRTGQQIQDRFGKLRFKTTDPFKWLEYLNNAGRFNEMTMRGCEAGQFFKYDFATATFVCVTASERPTRQELVSYANMVLSNCIQTLITGSETYSPSGITFEKN
jgi:hypothetical protein